MFCKIKKKSTHAHQKKLLFTIIWALLSQQTKKMNSLANYIEISVDIEKSLKQTQEQIDDQLKRNSVYSALKSIIEKFSNKIQNDVDLINSTLMENHELFKNIVEKLKIESSTDKSLLKMHDCFLMYFRDQVTEKKLKQALSTCVSQSKQNISNILQQIDDDQQILNLHYKASSSDRKLSLKQMFENVSDKCVMYLDESEKNYIDVVEKCASLLNFINQKVVQIIRNCNQTYQSLRENDRFIEMCMSFLEGILNQMKVILLHFMDQTETCIKYESDQPHLKISQIEQMFSQIDQSKSSLISHMKKGLQNVDDLDCSKNDFIEKIASDLDSIIHKIQTDDSLKHTSEKGVSVIESIMKQYNEQKNILKNNRQRDYYKSSDCKSLKKQTFVVMFQAIYNIYDSAMYHYFNLINDVSEYIKTIVKLNDFDCIEMKPKMKPTQSMRYDTPYYDQSQNKSYVDQSQYMDEKDISSSEDYSETSQTSEDDSIMQETDSSFENRNSDLRMYERVSSKNQSIDPEFVSDFVRKLKY